MRPFLPGLVTLRAQSIDQIKQKYPGERAVMLNHSMAYTISISEGQPKVQSNENDQILYLSDEAGRYPSRYGFIHSSLSELQQYQAYTRMANDKKVKVSDFTTSDSKSDGVFYDDVKETSFDFPAIAPGAIGNLEVSILHKGPSFFVAFLFHAFAAGNKLRAEDQLSERDVRKIQDIGR